MTAPEPKPKLFSRGTILAAVGVLLVGGFVALVSLAKGEPQRQVKFEVGGRRPTVSATELARWGIEGRRDYVVVDLRSSEDFNEGHIRGAVSCGTCHASAEEGKRAEEGDTFVDLTKKLVLYADNGTESMKLPKVLAANPRLYLLAGGYDAWKAQVMAPVGLAGEGDETQLAERRRREAIRAFYAGERPGTGNAATLPVAPIKRQSPHAPAKAAEGC